MVRERTLTMRCREPGCTEVARIVVPKDDRHRWRVVHGEMHTVQVWVDPPAGEDTLQWDKSKWK